MASDSEEDIRQAIANSLKIDQGSTAQQAIVLDEDTPPSKPKNAPSSNNTSLLGLDRKRMEQERLARKRKAPPDAPTHSQTLLSHSAESLKRHQPGRVSGFWEGVVKKTWVRGYPKDEDTITLEEIFDEDELQVAVLSSFQWDIPWLFAKLNGSKTLITLVMQAEDDHTKERYRLDARELPNVRLCFPNMEGQINCMHSKLMLLSYSKHLRIAVPTANLVSYDWGETGTMENMCFIIDLPRLPEGQRAEILTPFGKDLLFFLHAQGLEKSIVDSLSKFDFSATQSLAFIHTIGGAHTGGDEPWRRTGYCGLGRAVNMLGLATKEEFDVDFVTSSVGSLKTDFLSSIYRACQGDDGKAAYDVKNGGQSRQAKAAKVAKTKFDNRIVEEHFCVYFPTHDTVRQTTAGTAATICLQSNWYNLPTFPKAVMRDCRSTRKGLLMHNKLIFVHSSQPWAYVGSANCSESAWGSLVKDRETGQPKLNCRNWECGVLVPARMQRSSIDEQDEKVAQGVAASSSIAALQTVVPVPMVHPGAEYGTKKPWFFMEN